MSILKKTDANPLDYVLNDAGDSKKLASTLLKLLKDVSDPLVLKYSLTHIEDILNTNLNKVSSGRRGQCEGVPGISWPKPMGRSDQAQWVDEEE